MSAPGLGCVKQMLSKLEGLPACNELWQLHEEALPSQAPGN